MSGLLVEVLINDVVEPGLLNQRRSRRITKSEIVRSNIKTLWVKLPDGNVIKRKRGRDLP